MLMHCLDKKCNAGCILIPLTRLRMNSIVINPKYNLIISYPYSAVDVAT